MFSLVSCRKQSTGTMPAQKQKKKQAAPAKPSSSCDSLSLVVFGAIAVVTGVLIYNDFNMYA